MNLLYIADPMCSWCYGFAKTIDALLAEPGDAAPLQLALMMGGLRPYTTEAMAPERADEIFGHWAHVREASGQPFAAAPNTALHEPGFIYDTEPASRAVVAVRTFWPQHGWKYLHAVQRAFYAEGRNVTKPEVLADVAEAQGLPRAAFANAYASERMRAAVRADFEQAQAWGIRGFPALILDQGERLQLVCQGYLPLPSLRERLTAAARPAG
jgi:putative protein-disulfide isomerase